MTNIPDEMVERAAKAVKEFADNCAGDEWEIFDDDLALKVARAALEAALNGKDYSND